MLFFINRLRGFFKMIDFKNGALIKLSKTSDKAAKDVLPLLINNEEIIGCYKGVRDYVTFTTKRIISVNVQGITGKKKDFTSLPYSKIQVSAHFTTNQLSHEHIYDALENSFAEPV